MPKNQVTFVCQTCCLFYSKLFTFLKYNFYHKDLFPFLASNNHFGDVNVSSDSLLYSLCPCGVGQNIQEGPRKNSPDRRLQVAAIVLTRGRLRSLSVPEAPLCICNLICLNMGQNFLFLVLSLGHTPLSRLYPKRVG